MRKIDWELVRWEREQLNIIDELENDDGDAERENW